MHSRLPEQQRRKFGATVGSLRRPGIILVSHFENAGRAGSPPLGPYGSHSVNNGREVLRESLGKATAEHPLYQLFSYMLL